MINYIELIKIYWSYKETYFLNKILEIACEAVINGENHPAILELASLCNPDIPEIDDVLIKYYNEFHIPKNLAMRYLVLDIINKVIDKQISPYEGTYEICQYYYENEYPGELINFWRLKYAYIEAITEEEKFECEKFIIDECKKMQVNSKWLSTCCG
ncbi:hypothetical protein ACWNT8_06820 [Pigmentibacter ruber]